jgi:hypothetical protein
VHRHVVSMRDMVSGNYHWSRACGRYSREAAALLGPAVQACSACTTSPVRSA